MFVRNVGGRPSPAQSDDLVRTCTKHGEVIFRRFGDRWRCRRCVGESVTRRHRKVRAVLVAEAGGCCAVCGYDRCSLNLVFHHVNRPEKSFPMTVSRGKSLAAYRAEAQKCVLLCANCHGEIESGLIPSPPPRARFGDTPKENRARTSSVKGSRPSR